MKRHIERSVKRHKRRRERQAHLILSVGSNTNSKHGLSILHCTNHPYAGSVSHRTDVLPKKTQLKLQKKVNLQTDFPQALLVIFLETDGQYRRMPNSERGMTVDAR